MQPAHAHTHTHTRKHGERERELMLRGERREEREGGERERD